MHPHTGVIVFYLPDRGYGYLRLLGTREEFHFRKKNLLVDGLAAGDTVTFMLKEGRQGYYADEISKAGLA